MNDKLKKIIKYILILNLFTINLVSSLPIIKNVKAEEIDTYILDDRMPEEVLADFILPTFLGTRNKNNTDNSYYFSEFAKDLKTNFKNNGLEYADFLKRQGSDLIFKPSRPVWDVLKDTYNNFRNTQWSLVADGHFRFNVGTVYNYWYNKDNGTNLPGAIKFNISNEFGISNLQNYQLTFNSSTYNNNLEVAIGSRVYGLKGMDTAYKNDSIITPVSRSYFSSSFIVKTTVKEIDVRIRNIGTAQSIGVTLYGYPVGRSSEMKNIFNVHDITNTEVNYNIDVQINEIFPNSNEEQSSDELPTYRLNTNNYYNILNNNTVINNETIVNNNLITVFEGNFDDLDDITPEEEDDEPTIPPIENDNDYTNILTRILNAIKALPQQIVDLMPKFVNEAGTNIWDFLTAIVEAIGNIGTSIINGIMDNLLPVIQAILNIIFPTQEQLEESKNQLDNLVDTVQEKTDFITAPIQSFSSIYGSSRGAMFSSNNDTNLYNRTMIINDTEVHILPHSLESAISAFRLVSTGVVVILTMISIYTRFRGVVKH